jgi:hypothetical protein
METWKQIEGYNYQVSSLGRVKSLLSSKPKILKEGITPNGYRVVSLYDNKKKKTFSVHKLVAIYFLNHKPDKHKFVVDHINSNKGDNRVDNLQIITQRENCSKEKVIKSGLPVGVTLVKSSKRYKSSITINSNFIYLGCFDTELEASNAYQKALSLTE